MTTLQKKHAIAAFAALSLSATLAGCATEDATTPDDTSADAVTGPYEDGTYEATADYQSPNGTETIAVTLTLEGDIVTDVVVEGVSVNPSPEVERYQGEFEDGIAAEVVGKSLDDLAVDRVGGSSLTSGGFNEAVDQIKVKAQPA
jgi:uncharacterized protein with FMN-binding domain